MRGLADGDLKAFAAAIELEKAIIEQSELIRKIREQLLPKGDESH